MSSICRLLCMLIAASTIALATSAIISAATASPNSPTGELGTDAVYHAHDGLCKSKHPAHSFETTAPHPRTRQGTRHTHQWQCQYNPLDSIWTAHFALKPHAASRLSFWRMASYQFMCLYGPAGGPRHTIDDRSVCQTICDWNTSCAAYEWGAGCYLSSEWGFEAINLRFTEGGRAGADALVRYPLAPSLPPRAISAVCSFLGPMALHLPAPAHTPYHNPTTRQCTLEFLCQMSGRRATCYLKSIPPATDSKSCAGSPTRASCDDAVKLSASLAIAHAKKMVMTGDRWGGRGASGTRRDDQLTPVEERLTS